MDVCFIAFRHAFAGAQQWLPRPMPCPGPQNVVALHPLEPSIGVNSRGGECVTHMQWTIHVRVRESNQHLLPSAVGVSLEQSGLLPAFPPFLLDLRRPTHGTVESSLLL